MHYRLRPIIHIWQYFFCVFRQTAKKCQNYFPAKITCYMIYKFTCIFMRNVAEGFLQLQLLLCFILTIFVNNTFRDFEKKVNFRYVFFIFRHHLALMPSQLQQATGIYIWLLILFLHSYYNDKNKQYKYWI